MDRSRNQPPLIILACAVILGLCLVGYAYFRYKEEAAKAEQSAHAIRMSEQLLQGQKDYFKVIDKITEEMNKPTPPTAPTPEPVPPNVMPTATSTDPYASPPARLPDGQTPQTDAPSATSP